MCIQARYIDPNTAVYTTYSGRPALARALRYVLLEMQYTLLMPVMTYAQFRPTQITIFHRTVEFILQRIPPQTNRGIPQNVMFLILSSR